MSDWRPSDTAPRDGTELLPQYDKSAISDGAVRIIGRYFTSPKQIDDGWETDLGSIGMPVAWMSVSPSVAREH